MVLVTNKKTTVETGKDSVLKYSDIIKQIVNTPPKDGFSVEIMKQSLRIVTAIENEKKGTISIEDGDFDALKISVNAFRWAIIHKDLLSFVEYINSLQPSK
jgi:hypothetical protein